MNVSFILYCFKVKYIFNLYFRDGLKINYETQTNHNSKRGFKLSYRSGDCL